MQTALQQVACQVSQNDDSVRTSRSFMCIIISVKCFELGSKLAGSPPSQPTLWLSKLNGIHSEILAFKIITYKHIYPKKLCYNTMYYSIFLKNNGISRVRCDRYPGSTTWKLPPTWCKIVPSSFQHNWNKRKPSTIRKSIKIQWTIVFFQNIGRRHSKTMQQQQQQQQQQRPCTSCNT